jgi:hypothetical protein
MLGGGALLAALAGGAQPAAAWGSEGHQVVGYLAERFLTAPALVEVRALVTPGGLPQVSTWADAIRQARPETKPWHFVDIDIRAAGYVPARDCPQGACAVEAIQRYAARMADHRLPLAQRQEALKFVVHFVGDLHQPLHACDDRDHGGNGVAVQLAGRREDNLHAVWDSATVAALGSSTAEIGAALTARVRGMAPAERAAVAAGGPLDWATESWTLCREEVYAKVDGGHLQPGGTHGAVVPLPDDYGTEERAVTEDRLLRAGLRLAAVLNARLGNPAPGPAVAQPNTPRGPDHRTSGKRGGVTAG